MDRKQLVYKRACIYKPDYVKEHQLKCERCGKNAFATFYDEEWNPIDLCKNCLEKQ